MKFSAAGSDALSLMKVSLLCIVFFIVLCISLYCSITRVIVKLVRLT